MNNIVFPNAKKFKFPIVIHIYTAFLLIIFAIGLLYIKFFSNDVNVFVRKQCSDRIETSVLSTKDLIPSVVTSLSSNSEIGASYYSEDLDNLSLALMSSDVSVSFLQQNDDATVSILWPTDKTSSKVVNQFIDSAIKKEESGIQESGIFNVSDKEYFYYKIMPVDISSNHNYFALYYIPASNYFDFANLLFESLFRTTLIAILGTGLLCILISIPLIISIYKMVRFSKRIANGDFSNYHTFVVSRELQDLSDGMNFMSDRLRENDKEQKQFFQNVSHELRTPLQSIQGYAEGLKYDVFVDDDKDTAINVIINESERLSSMVENLLSISKMDMAKNGNYEVKKTNISISELIGHEIENIRGNILLNKKELIQSSDVGDKMIYANEGDILRMLDNIFSNCIRYARQNIYFYTSIENDYVNFTIYDDGDGFTEEVLANMFTRFAKGSDGKHGIGLSLVKAIAEEHKGSIKAYNKEGFGACFEIRIPCESPNSQLSNTNKNK